MSDNLLILRALYHALPKSKTKLRKELEKRVREIRRDKVESKYYDGGYPSRSWIKERPKLVAKAIKKVDKEPI